MEPADIAQLEKDVEAFCQEVRPVEELCYLEHRFNREAIELARKYNLLGIPVAQEFGGRGADLTAYLAALVRIGREGSGLRTLFSGHTSIGQYPIARFGSPDQQRKYLEPSSAGEKIMAFGLTEPEAGSNPLEIQSTYRREGDHYRLNGIKYLISNGGIADTIVLFAYPQEGDSRMSAFIVDTDGPGIEREDMTAKLGLPTSNTAMFELSDYAVPVENMLGLEGDGFRIAMETLVSGRLSVAAGCLGVIEDCLEETIQYAKQREQHGKPIARHQLVQQHIARIELARQTTASFLVTAAEAKVASDLDREDRQRLEHADLLAAEVKFVASNLAFEAADRALQVFGGRGYSELFRPARHWKDVRVCRIYEGTDEILQLKIAASLLGKDYSAFS
ncbi:MAG: acyl-CoA dehydrogenase family protein [Pirellulaceae bacterium]